MALSTIWWAQPYLAITKTTGSNVLVVEGWMDSTGIGQAARLATDSGYTRVYTTGTIRPFAYLLAGGEGVGVELEATTTGTVELDIVGNAGARFNLLADGDTLLSDTVYSQPRTFRRKTNKPVRSLLLMAAFDPNGQDLPLVFVRGMTLNGTNINHLQGRSWFLFADGSTKPAWPTYADLARSELIDLGIPPAQVTAVPALGYPRSRSWGNAVAFAAQADRDGIQAFDLATSGVHARRSRKFFRIACARPINVGVIALEDPCCTRSNWWKNPHGRLTLIKELIGLPVGEVVRTKRPVHPARLPAHRGD